MAIGVQNTSAALLALQTLNRLNDPSQSGQADAAASLGDTSQSGPSVIAESGAQALSADSLGTVTAGLDRAASITDAALAAGQTVSGLLDQMKTLVSGGDGASGAGVNKDFASLVSQLSAAVSGAGFDGVNLLDGSAGSSVTVGLGPDASMANLSTALGQISDQSRQIQAHAAFVSRLSDVLALGAGADVAPPTSADGARLMALQVQQQLATQGGSIANSAPQVLLSLFK